MVDTAPQHGPRPLPLLLSILQHALRNEPAALGAALGGLRRYQAAPRVPNPMPAHVRVAHGKARLLSHRAHASGPPVLLVPSLINGPEILALLPGFSMVHALDEAGFDAMLLDWGLVGPQDHALDLDAHVETLLAPLIAGLGAAPHLLGYCLGGTLALAAACLMPPASLTTIAAPWHLAAYGAEGRDATLARWQQIKLDCAPLGLVPVEALQPFFWALDPDRLARKYIAFGQEEDPDPRFVAIEDWANRGEPIAFAAAAQLFERLIAADDSGAGRWRIGGQRIAPDALHCPTLGIVAAGDRIVPAAAAPPLRDRISPPLGHVGMIVSRDAPARMWEPLIAWLKAQN